MQALSVQSRSAACGLRVGSAKRSSFTAPAFRTSLAGARAEPQRPAAPRGMFLPHWRVGGLADALH